MQASIPGSFETPLFFQFGVFVGLGYYKAALLTGEDTFAHLLDMNYNPNTGRREWDSSGRKP